MLVLNLNINYLITYLFVPLYLPNLLLTYLTTFLLTYLFTSQTLVKTSIRQCGTGCLRFFINTWNIMSVNYTTYLKYLEAIFHPRN